MNNACPSCGTVYAVAAKDIGRKIKCKKCGTALLVSDDGLVVDSGRSAAPAVVAAEVEDDTETFETGDDDEVVSPRKKGKKSQRDRQAGGGMDFGAMLAKVGGVPTILFGIGVALVIWYTFMPKIGEAAILRAAMGPDKLEAEMANRLAAVIVKPKDGKAPSEEEMKKASDAEKKIHEEYEPKLKEARENAQNESIGNVRDLWYERYGTLFGFLFVAFGCIGYLKTEQPLILRIVAGVILSFMMIVVFSSYGGCDKDSTPKAPAKVKMG